MKALSQSAITKIQATIIAIIIIVALVAGVVYYVTLLSPTPTLKIKLGVPAPYSGTSSAQGQQIKDGVMFAVEQVNEEGGLLVGGQRYPIEPVFADTEAKADVGRAVVERLATIDKVDVVVGHFMSSVFLACMDLYQKYKIPVIDVAAASQDIYKNIRDKKLDYCFQLSPTMDIFAGDLAGTIMHYMKPSKVASVMSDSSSGWSTEEALVKWFNSNAPEVEIVLKERVPVGTTDYYPLLAKLNNLGVQVVFFEFGGEEGKAFHTQWYELKYPMYVAYIQRLPDAYLEGHWSELDGAIMDIRWYPGPHTPKTQPFLEAFKQRYGYDATNWAVQGYDGVLVMFEAIKIAGKIDKAAIRDALLKVDMDCVWGHRKFTPLEDGQRMPTETVVAQIQDGKFVPVWPLSLAQSMESKWRPVPPWPWEKS
jgi:branched-chain amino acid transport system substrate-binding protein